MNTTTENRAKMGKITVLGLLLAMLLLMALSSAPAGAVVTSGKAFAWGHNEFGQLGNGTHGLDTGKNIPVAVGNLSGVKSVKAGADHGLAFKTDGTVRAWGYNQYGQLGNGNTGTDSDVPVAVRNLTNVRNMDGGYVHTLAATQ